MVEDDRGVAHALALLLRQAGYAVEAAASPAEASRKLDAGPFQLVLSDMNFSRATTGAEGLDLLRAIRARHPRLPVILMTAWGSIELAVAGMRAGASDFVTKPWTNETLLQTVRTALHLASAGPPPDAPSRKELAARYDLAGLVGEDPRFLRVLDVALRVSGTDAPVLVTGESGTGKELIAEAIHRNSPRKDGPLVKVNASAIPPTLFESEMFGHVAGAFTDARHERKGRFELAHGGTIFLDEVGDVDLGSQVKLLRVLQDRTFEVLGTSKTRTVDVRVVSATNRHLAKLVEKGEFREDLLYRLNLISVHLPALRERVSDIPLLSRTFLDGLAKVYRRPGLALRPEAVDWLRGQPWPGNVRQLRHLIERAVLVSGRDELDVADFVEVARLAQPQRESSPDALPGVGSMTLEEIEKAMIVKALKHHGDNISRTAEALGMSRAALYRRLEKFGLT